MYSFLKILFYLTCVIAFSACDKKSKVESTDSYIKIFPENMDLHKEVIVPWHVGPKKDQTLSKGFRVSIRFPRLDLAAMDDIITRFSVDSWLIVVKRRSLATSTIIGQVFIPISIPGRFSDSKFRRLQMENGFISIYFAAAAISKRFETFPCPALGHNRVIDSIEVERVGQLEPLYVSVSELHRISGKVVEFGYDSTILNGGQSLQGDYSFEIALYNSESRNVMSNFVQSPDILKVTKEVINEITGCENFVIPPPEDEGNKWDQFKWKR